MLQALRRRFWSESILASLAAGLGIVTVFWHDWIEALFGVDPDKGNGITEWLVVAILLLLAVVLAIVARLEWRRAQTSET